MNRVVCKKYFMVIFLLLMLFPIKTYAVERYEGKYLTVYSDKPITENDSCSKFANETNLANKYGMNFSWKKDHFLLKINGKDMKDDVKNNANVKFTVTIANINITTIVITKAISVIPFLPFHHFSLSFVFTKFYL